MTGRSYDTVEDALVDGFSEEEVKQALDGKDVHTTVKYPEWELKKEPTTPTGNRVSKEEEGLLEQMIDRHGMQAVIESLSEIAFEKADHIRTNWQDDRTARTWERVGKRLDGLTV